MTPTAPLPQVPQLDESALARLRELDPDGRNDLMRRVMRTYENSLQRQMAELVEAGRRGDAGAVGGIAHMLKSSSASVGASTLAQCCADIEGALRAGPTSDLAGQVEKLLAQGEQALAAVRAMLGN